MKKKLVATLLTSTFILGGVATPTFAKGLNVNSANSMYAVAGSTGTITTEGIAAGRVNVNNALNNNGSFYSVGSHNFSKFTFDKSFYNVDGEADINFSEVTWGNYWNEEAVEVYLVNPVIATSNGNKPYNKKDIKLSGNNDNLYFAGVAYNKIVNNNNNAWRYEEYQTNKGINHVLGSVNVVDGNVGFNLPDEVISAEGIVLVDITGKVNKEFYKNESLLNDDGFDLASIKVYGRQEFAATVKEEVKLSELNDAEIANGVTRDIVLENGETIGSYTVQFNDGTKKKIKVTYNLNDEYEVIDEENHRRCGVSLESLDDAENNQVKFGNTVNLGDSDIEDTTIYLSINLPVAKK